MSDEKIPDGYTELRKVYESLQNEYAELRQEMKDGLRDQFAAAAMQGMLSSPDGGPSDWESLARGAYEAADAMLAARERKEESK
jgi:hypothetical protein